MKEALGMTITNLKKKEPDETIHYKTGKCAFGFILVAYSEKGICANLIHNDDNPPTRRPTETFPQSNTH